jgi:hypothetical protein
MNRISKEILSELDDQDKDSLETKGYKTGDAGTIDFIKNNGARQMFPYSQLITAWTENTDQYNVIKLFFSTHLVTLKGYNLAKVYELIRLHKLEIIVARDERYMNRAKGKQAYVTGIEIEWKKTDEVRTSSV